MPRLQEPSEGSELNELSERVDNDAGAEARRQRPRRKSQKLREDEDQSILSDAGDLQDDDEEEEAEAEAEPEARTVNVDDSDSSLSLPPDSPPPKKTGRPRKGSSAVSKTAKPEASVTASGKANDITPSKTRRTGGGRGGGNKRKHPHEYCLTCANYGRACSGRREGHLGCAVCREPDRSKGEKLRECLWAEPEKGILTYPQAKEILKIAQAEERAKQGKAPTKRQLPFLSEEQRRQYLSTPDTIGLVESRTSTVATDPPPVSRPLNVRPPPSAVRQRQMLSGIESHAKIVDPYKAFEVDPDTIIVNRSARSPGLRSAPKLFVETGSLDDQPQPARAYTARLPQPTATQPLTDATGRRIPYYDPNLEAYVLPAYPHSNLLPPHMQDRTKHVSYMSVYDAYPFLPVVMPNAHTHYRRPAPPPSSSETPVTVPSSPHSRRNDAGTPTRRYNRSDSITSNVSGYDVSLKMWKLQPPAQVNSQITEENVVDATGEETQKPERERFRNSSSLSSAPSALAQSRADPIEADDQPQVSRSRSLSPQQQMLTDQAAILPAKYIQVPERKRKRVGRPASPEILTAPAVPQTTTNAVQTVEYTVESNRNGRESSLISASSLRSDSVPSIGKSSRPPLAKTYRRSTSAGSSLSDIPGPSKTPAVNKTPLPVPSSGWQAVNTVDKSVEVVTSKTSPVRSRKKRRTKLFDIEEDKNSKGK